MGISQSETEGRAPPVPAPSAYAASSDIPVQDSAAPPQPDGEQLDADDPRRVVRACTQVIAEGVLNRRDTSFVYTKRGLAYRALNQNEMALSDFCEAVKLNANQTDAYFNRAIIYMTLGRYDDAIRDFSLAITLDRSIVEFYRWRACAYHRVERLSEAVADYGRALHLEPKDARTLFQRGRAHAELGRRKPAIEDYRAALALDPGLECARRGLASVMRRNDTRPTGHEDPAERCLERALAHRRAKRYGDALLELRHAISLAPNNAEYLRQEGLTLRMLKRYGDAVTAYSKALEIDPGFANALAGRAWAYYKWNRASDGLPDIDCALEIEPRNAIFHDTRGHIYEALRLSQAARRDYAAAAELRPDLRSSVEGLRRLEADGSCAEDQPS